MSLRSRTVGTTTALVLAVAGMAACQPTAPPVIPAIAGLATTYVAPSRAETGGGSITTITLTTTHTLKVTCAAGQRLVINGTTTGVACAAMESLQITGTNTADDVTVELQANPDVVVNLLAGNDRSFVASRGTSTTNGGDGNDNISAVTLLPYGTAGGAATEVSSLNGGSGNDTLTDLGWDDGNPKTTNDTVAGDVSDIGMRLDGGPGADVLHGSPVRPELVTADPYDTLDLYGPADVTLQGTPGPDTIAVDLNGNYGPKGNVTTPDGVARPFALPTNTARLTIDGGAGADAITVGHRSSHTDVMVANSAGGDRVTLRPSVASFLVDRTQRTLSQGSPWHDMSWGDQVNPTITLLARP